MIEDDSKSKERSSIIVLLATDAPMLPHQLKRIAKRAALGIGRTGTPGGNNSGDIFLAFSTANISNIPQLYNNFGNMNFINDELFDDFYLATVESTEESIINAMLAAKDTMSIRQKGHLVSSLKPSDLD